MDDQVFECGRGGWSGDVADAVGRRQVPSAEEQRGLAIPAASTAMAATTAATAASAAATPLPVRKTIHDCYEWG